MKDHQKQVNMKKIVPRRIWGMPLIPVVAAAMLIAAPAEAKSKEEASRSGAAKQVPRSKKKARLVGVININTAKFEELILLPKIGKATAERIIQERQKRPFNNALEIVRVRGIGKKTFLKLREYLAVEGKTTLKMERRAKKGKKQR